MLRYLRALADKDLALDRTMIPLGSCTMKLNATTELLPVTWPEFAHLHPVRARGPGAATASSPASSSAGCARSPATTPARCSRTPARRASRRADRDPRVSREPRRRSMLSTWCWSWLRPRDQSGLRAHGWLRGGRGRDRWQGNVDLDDLAAKAAKHAADLAAIMITYPSTHGVHEPNVREVCEIVHAHGGQVYLDGANSTRSWAARRPGPFGADVSHLNLHKTFCIPHGGGGPGRAGRGRLRTSRRSCRGIRCRPARRWAAWGRLLRRLLGSAGILPISWAFVALMGGRGVTEAARVAVLNANYVAKRGSRRTSRSSTPGGRRRRARMHRRSAAEGRHGGHRRRHREAADRLRHPCADDVVPGAGHADGRADRERVQREPRPLRRRDDRDPRRDPGDRRCGHWPRDDNPLKHALHTARAVSADEWTYPYPRPAPRTRCRTRAAKYWSPVGRVDNAYGDRHLAALARRCRRIRRCNRPAASRLERHERARSPAAIERSQGAGSAGLARTRAGGRRAGAGRDGRRRAAARRGRAPRRRRDAADRAERLPARAATRAAARAAMKLGQLLVARG